MYIFKKNFNKKSKKISKIKKKIDLKDVKERYKKFQIDCREKITFLKKQHKNVIAFGAAQIGIAGEDVIEEFDYSEVYAPMNLNIGHCKISVAAPKSLIKKEDPETWSNVRVATKYPNITKKFFANKGIQVEIIKLSGSMELAPTLKMCRRIVDLVSTGTTLKVNGLIEVEEIMKIQSKLIVNRSAYKTEMKKIKNIIGELQNFVK